MSRRYAVLACLAVACLAGGVAVAESNKYNTPRQYYGAWSYNAAKKYHYRPYYYKPTPTYSGYKHHYVTYHPSKPKHVYYYNPYSKKYWGRCPTESTGEEAYSLLPEEKRKPNLEDINEGDFPEPGEMPEVPDSKDGIKMDRAPDDLPAAGPQGGGVPIIG